MDSPFHFIKMKNIIALLLSTILLISCKQYTQLYETKPISKMSIEKDSYVFENDTVKIVFSFWDKRGALKYTFYNKLNIPIYIDWKKSSFIKNGQKLDYWQDQSTTTSLEYYKSEYFYGASYGKKSGKSTTVKPEKIIFVAPKSSISKSSFYLTSPLGIELKKAKESKAIVPNLGGKDNPISVKTAEFTEGNSPLIFRNFITISTTDDFKHESYIDNGFYISKVYQMNSRDFGYSYYEKDVWYLSTPFKNNICFYVPLGAAK
jgi:hypothetical protein